MQYIFNYLAVQCMQARLICSLCYGGLLKNMYKVIEKVCPIIFITTIVIGGYCLFWLTLLVRCSMTKWLRISKILEVVQKLVPRPCGNISPWRLTVWYLFNVIPSPSFFIKREKLLLIFLKAVWNCSARQPSIAVQLVGEVREELLALLLATPFYLWCSGISAEGYWWENHVLYRAGWLRLAEHCESVSNS